MIRQLFLSISLFALFVTTTACEQVMLEDTSKPALSVPKVTSIDSYFSPYSHGPLLKLYDYQAENVILALRISNRSREMPIKANLAIFAPTESRKAIEKWINNQHSDALYGDAANPVTQLNIADHVTILSKERTGDKIGRSGEEYQTYQITFHVREIESNGFRLPSFDDTGTVQVRINDGKM